MCYILFKKKFKRESEKKPTENSHCAVQMIVSWSWWTKHWLWATCKSWAPSVLLSSHGGLDCLPPPSQMCPVGSVGNFSLLKLSHFLFPSSSQISSTVAAVFNVLTTRGEKGTLAVKKVVWDRVTYSYSWSFFSDSFTAALPSLFWFIGCSLHLDWWLNQSVQPCLACHNDLPWLVWLGHHDLCFSYIMSRLLKCPLS